MKKAAIGAGAVVALGLAIYGWGYFRTVGNNIKEAAQDAVPTQLKLDRAEDMLKNELHPKINELRETVAKAELDVERAEAAKKETIAQLDSKRADMLARHSSLKDNPTQESFQIKTVSYSRAQIEDDLNHRLSAVKTLDAKLASQEKTLAAKAKAHSANKDRLVAYQKAEDQLKAKIDQLRASLEAVKAQEDIAENVDSDDSELKDLEALLSKIDEDVTVRSKIVDSALAGQDSSSEIPVESSSDKSAINAVDAYLNNSNRTEPVASSGTKTEIPIE